MIRRAGSALVAAACALLAGWLASHHPLSPALALAGCALLAGLTLAGPARWPLWLLPLLPVCGLMTWSGWLIVEELDLMVLAVAAGGWLRLAAGWPAAGRWRGTRSLAPVALIVLPYALSALIGVQRGVADAGGLSWGWWQGYREPLNSLRLAKPFFEALLLLPLWRGACRAEGPAAEAHLVAALQGLLLAVGLAVLWERLAHTGLADFSTDYRVTGPFWEMHTGGAALDATLALVLPFAVSALAAARTPVRWAAAAAVLVLGGYAALVTFSRAVYLALPLGVAVTMLLRAVQRPRAVSLRPLWAAVAWLAGFVLAAGWLFPAAGHRGLLALLGAVALLLPLAAALRALAPSRRWLGAALGLPWAGAVALLAGLPKGAYVAYAASWAAAAAALWVTRQRPQGAAAVWGLAAYCGTLAGLVAVGSHWGGEPALVPGATLAAALAAIALVAGARPAPPWPPAWRWQAQLICALAAVAALVAVFGGGAYMGQRFADTSRDSLVREDHWRHSLGLLRGADWLLGKGLGRFWASQMLSDRPQDSTGDYRLLPAGAGRDHAVVALSSGGHELGSAEVLKFSQRIPLPALPPLTLRLDVSTGQAVKLESEVCSKHLLYPGECQVVQQEVQPRPGSWQAVEMRYRGEMPTRGRWYAPRLTVFAIGLGRNRQRVEIDHLSLTDGSGRELLTNGDFGQGLAHWYFTSDRYHLPFHAKNLVLHLLFEQGAFGLAAFALVVAAALWRVSLGAARRAALAPVLAGAIAGVLVVGGVDSLLDIPRIAFLIWLLLGVALCLPAGSAGAAGTPRTPGPGPKMRG